MRIKGNHELTQMSNPMNERTRESVEWLIDDENERITSASKTFRGTQTLQGMEFGQGYQSLGEKLFSNIEENPLLKSKNNETVETSSEKLNNNNNQNKKYHALNSEHPDFQKNILNGNTWLTHNPQQFATKQSVGVGGGGGNNMNNNSLNNESDTYKIYNPISSKDPNRPTVNLIGGGGKYPQREEEESVMSRSRNTNRSNNNQNKVKEFDESMVGNYWSPTESLVMLQSNRDDDIDGNGKKMHKRLVSNASGAHDPPPLHSLTVQNRKRDGGRLGNVLPDYKDPLRNMKSSTLRYSDGFDYGNEDEDEDEDEDDHYDLPSMNQTQPVVVQQFSLYPNNSNIANANKKYGTLANDGMDISNAALVYNPTYANEESDGDDDGPEGIDIGNGGSVMMPRKGGMNARKKRVNEFESDLAGTSLADIIQMTNGDLMEHLDGVSSNASTRRKYLQMASDHLDYRKAQEFQLATQKRQEEIEKQNQQRMSEEQMRMRSKQQRTNNGSTRQQQRGNGNRGVQQLAVDSAQQGKEDVFGEDIMTSELGKNLVQPFYRMAVSSGATCKEDDPECLSRHLANTPCDKLWDGVPPEDRLVESSFLQQQMNLPKLKSIVNNYGKFLENQAPCLQGKCEVVTGISNSSLMQKNVDIANIQQKTSNTASDQTKARSLPPVTTTANPLIQLIDGSIATMKQQNENRSPRNKKSNVNDSDDEMEEKRHPKNSGASPSLHRKATLEDELIPDDWYKNPKKLQEAKIGGGGRYSEESDGMNMLKQGWETCKYHASMQNILIICFILFAVIAWRLVIHRTVNGVSKSEKPKIK